MFTSHFPSDDTATSLQTKPIVQIKRHACTVVHQLKKIDPTHLRFEGSDGGFNVGLING